MSTASPPVPQPVAIPVRRAPAPRLIGAVAGFATLVVACVAGAIVGAWVSSPSPSPVRAPLTTAAVAAAPPPHTVAAAALGRTVTVETERGDAEELGTAWLLDNHGDFVTNAHLVEGHLSVRLADRAAHRHVGVIMGVDREQDIAVIRALDGFSAAPLPLAGSADPPLHSTVVAIASGRATGHEDITVMAVLRLHQDVPVKGNSSIDPSAGTTTVLYRDMIELDGAVVYAGNSGGPVLDGTGRVVGIVTLKSRSLPEAFAIPLPRVLDEIRAFAERSTPQE